MKSRIKFFRNNPKDFFQLPIAKQNNLLNTVCGDIVNISFKKSHCPDSKFRTVSFKGYPGDGTDDGYFLCQKLTSFIIHDRNFARLVACMTFFRVEYFNEVITFQWHAFKYFEFGCFSDYAPHLTDVTQHTSWECHLYGYLSSTLLYYITHDLHTCYYEIVSWSVYSNFRMRSPIEIEWLLDFIKSQSIQNVQFNISRWKKIEYIISDLPLPAHSQCPHFKYAYLANKYIPEGLRFNRPVWSRENHSRICHDDFKKRVLTVLCIWKFHKTVFPLHKDLIVILFKQLFELELLDFEAKDSVHVFFKKGRNRLD